MESFATIVNNFYQLTSVPRSASQKVCSAFCCSLSFHLSVVFILEKVNDFLVTMYQLFFDFHKNKFKVSFSFNFYSKNFYRKYCLLTSYKSSLSERCYQKIVLKCSKIYWKISVRGLFLIKLQAHWSQPY